VVVASATTTEITTKDNNKMNTSAPPYITFLSIHPNSASSSLPSNPLPQKHKSVETRRQRGFVEDEEANP